MTRNWTPLSWREFPSQQLPTYPNAALLAEVERRLAGYPVLVSPQETELLKQRLAQVARGEAFLLQGGDCAESFDGFSLKTLRDNFNILLQMAEILTKSIGRPIVKVGRVAGQFAKPRSSETETRSGVTLPAYRGDMINNFSFSAEARIPDPARMDQAYGQSAETLAYLRMLSGEEKTELFSSHEALLLPYEQALTRRHGHDGEYDWYDGSAHMLWIGERTRQLEGAHIEFARGIRNPLGLKCGPDITPDELLKLIGLLNPSNEAGRLTLVTRMGRNKIEAKLPSLIRAVKSSGAQVGWCCDPMHGNTMTTLSGYKTRVFEDVLTEAKRFFEVHKAEGTFAGGVHFEQTGKDVTECIGGNPKILEEHLAEGLYETLCDPRLNASQALELARQLCP